MSIAVSVPEFPCPWCAHPIPALPISQRSITVFCPCCGEMAFLLLDTNGRRPQGYRKPLEPEWKAWLIHPVIQKLREEHGYIDDLLECGCILRRTNDDRVYCFRHENCGCGEVSGARVYCRKHGGSTRLMKSCGCRVTFDGEFRACRDHLRAG